MNLSDDVTIASVAKVRRDDSILEESRESEEEAALEEKTAADEQDKDE